jgi:hypothetical protein
MNDLSFWYEIIKTWGIGALFALIFIGIFKKVIAHYQILIQNLLNENSGIAKGFMNALESNTAAIHGLSKVHLEVSNTMQNICAGIDRNAAQNREEHHEILKYVQGGK